MKLETLRAATTFVYRISRNLTAEMEAPSVLLGHMIKGEV